MHDENKLCFLRYTLEKILGNSHCVSIYGCNAIENRIAANRCKNNLGHCYRRHRQLISDIFLHERQSLIAALFFKKLYADLSCDPAANSPARFLGELWQTAGSDVRVYISASPQRDRCGGHPIKRGRQKAGPVYINQKNVSGVLHSSF